MKKLFLILLVPVAGLVMLSCQSKTKSANFSENNTLLYSTLYVQRAAEYKALCFQAYNMARLSLDKKIEDYQGEKKLAVVVDIDETVLDNSPHSAKCILENTSYPEYWDKWCYLAKAKAIPGSLEFLKYAQSKGVEIFYISNRKAYLTKATLKNLKYRGFPYATEDHILLRISTSDKEDRRNKVRETHDILLFCGDDLGDFNSAYVGQTTKTRNYFVPRQAYKFSSEYIVLPNPIYGSWLNAMTNDMVKEAKNDSLYRTKLIGF